MEKMEKIVLKATERTAHGKKLTALRAAGSVPAVAYGHGMKSESLLLDRKEVERAYHMAGGNKIVALKVGDHQAKNALMSHVQHDALRGFITHVDFYLVRMDEELKAEVPLHFIGESLAVYQGEGTLLKNLETIEIECLPGDLPDGVEVDITALDDFEKTITVADLKLSDKIKLLTNPDSLVAKVEPPRTAEQMAELEAEVTEELPEGAIEKSAETAEAKAE